MKPIILLALALVLPASGLAQSAAPIQKPEIRKGDSWTYRSNNVLGPGAADYELRVEKADDKTILVVATRKGDDKEFDATFTAEWNPVVGVSGLIFEPPPRIFAFPMQVGDSRSLSYTSSRPRTNIPPSKYESRVEVAGWEEVTVPAGKFRALRVVVQGVFFPPESRSSANIRIQYWYVPEVRRWVKLRFELPKGEATEELLEFKLNAK